MDRCVCLCLCASECTLLYKYVCIWANICVHVYINMHRCVSICFCAYAFPFIFVHVCAYNYNLDGFFL